MRTFVLSMIVMGLPWLAYGQRLGEPSLVWNTIHTEHFRVTFPVGLEGLAQEAAVAAEDAHQYLLAQLGYAPSGKIDIVLCDAADTAHRELDLVQNKITIWVAQGELAERYNPKFPSWVEQSVFALYAQLVSADFVFGVSEVLRPLLGRLVLPNLKPSRLLTGIGEYLAEEALSTPPDVRPDVGGEHRFVRYLTERFGADLLKEWHRLQANDLWATLSLGFASNYDRIFRHLTGRSFAQIIEEWQGLSSLPPHGKGKGTEAKPETLLTIQHDIVKHSYLYGDLYLSDPTTKRKRRLTRGARVYRAALFPDGQKVLVAHHRWGDQGPILALLDLQTLQMQTLKEFPMHDYFIDSFAISPDGEQVALSIWRRGGYQDIYLLSAVSCQLSADGCKLTAITRDRAVDLSPAFSPDGEYLLFSSDRDGISNLYAYRMADGGFFRVTNMLTGAFDPDISPDRTEIAFVTYSLQGYELRTMPFDPHSWRPVQIGLEPFPPWDGFPDTEYPITPYDPRPSLEPTLWVPLPGWNSLSLLTFGSDALKQHLYSILLGFNWQTLQPSYRVSYHNRVLLSSLETVLERAGRRAHQSVTATLPLATSVSTQQSLALFYRRDEEDFISHRIGLEWRGRWKIFQNWLGFSLWVVTQTRTGQRRWENHLGFGVAATTPLPLGLHGSIFAEWGEGFTQPPLLRVELEFSPDVALRLGLIWDAEQQSVTFYLR